MQKAIRDTRVCAINIAQMRHAYHDFKVRIASPTSAIQALMDKQRDCLNMLEPLFSHYDAALASERQLVPVITPRLFSEGAVEGADPSVARDYEKKLQEEDWCGILEVSQDATEDNIKTAYRLLLLKWHPDKNKNSQASTVFKCIQAAYT